MEDSGVKFSTRTLPWMKLGTVIEKAVSPKQAIKLAKLNWTVEKVPVYVNADGPGIDNTGLVEVPNRFATRRSSDGMVFDIVGDTYETYQNSEAFDFLEPLTEDGSIKIHAAGQLRGGRQVFVVAEVPNALDVLDDPHELFAVVRTGHDGTKAVQVMLMGLRGMCMNMLGLPSFGRDAKQRWSVAHISTLRERLLEAQSTLKSIDEYASEYQHTAERLAAVNIELDEFRKLLTDTLPARPKTEEAVDRMAALFTGSETIPERFRNTGWGAINAITEYMDWGRERSTDEGRFHSAMDGTGARIRARATAMLLAR